MRRTINLTTSVLAFLLASIVFTSCYKTVTIIHPSWYGSLVAGTCAGTGVAGYGSSFGGGDLKGDGHPATAADLYLPKGIIMSRSGVFYIAEAGNNVIRKLSK